MPTQTMEWGSPESAVWLWALPAVALVFLLSAWRRQRLLRRFGDPALVARLTESLDAARRFAKRLCVFAAAALIVGGLCQPHFRKKETVVERKGLDIMIAIDVSRSMLAKDIAPTRLDKAKLELSELVERLKGDRIGVVAFAGEAVIQCPLTLDHGATKLFLSTVSPDLIPTPGTAIGTAIVTAATAFVDQEQQYKALILLTDGEDHGSDPLGAVAQVKKQGLRVFTIGIGTGDGATLPAAPGSSAIKKDVRGQPVISKLNEELLSTIAQETGGAYYRSSRGSLEIDRLVQDLRKMTPKDLRKEVSVEYEESYQWLTLAAFLLLAAEMFLSERRPLR